jgi:predicted dehydrogenase
VAKQGKVGLGFIGCGGNARHHMAQVLQLDGFEVVALNDPNPEMIETAKRKYTPLTNVRAFPDYLEMLASMPLDAVLISTPHTLHCEQILAALDMDLHVLCEKPLVCSVGDAHAVIDRLRTSGKVGLLSYQRHYQPEFRYIRDKISSGDWGKVTFVSALQCQAWKKGTAGTWRQVPELSGGGQLNDSGSHLLDIILWTTGLSVEKVSAFIDNCGTQVDINSALTLLFRGGAQGNISIVGDAPKWHEDLTIWCEKGCFLLRDGKLTVVDQKGNRATEARATRAKSTDRVHCIASARTFNKNRIFGFC